MLRRFCRGSGGGLQGEELVQVLGIRVSKSGFGVKG